MAQNKTRYARKAVLDHFLGRISYPFPAAVYLGLFTADPTEFGLLDNEIVSAGYGRVEISALLGDASATTGTISNTADIEFPEAEEDWPEVTHLAVLDAATAGNMLYFGPAVTSRIVENLDSLIIKIGQLTIEER